MMKFGLLHPRAVARAIYYGQRWRLKRWLGIPDRPRAPVLHGGLDQAVERYRRICRTLLPHLASGLPKNFVAAEIGCGDCLAAADMMLGLGAQHVHLVEHQAMPLTPLHRQALSRTISPDLPNRASILSSDDPPRLNPSFASLHVGLLENLSLPQPVDLVYSFDVLEHVEDLDAFFSCCRRTLKPGGLSLHKFDLSGHEFFEDPMPPLDFQTYPRWLYRLMFPRYRRAVGNFADLFFDLMRKNGFEILEIVPLRVADPDYLRTIRPKLRKEARMKSDEILRFLDLVVLARRT
jgi:SAM-dependent methyltransferase